MMQNIAKAASAIAQADAVLVGASNGLSIAEGYRIFAHDERFCSCFADFEAKYGFTSLIQGCFQRFESEEEYWAFFARQAWHYGLDYRPSPVMRALKGILEDKAWFILTSNGDSHLEQSGFAEEQIFEIEGRFTDMQCRACCHDAVYPIADPKGMLEAMDGMRVASRALPRCPKCGGPMQVHLDLGRRFLKGRGWQAAQARFQNFVRTWLDRRLCVLELGIGSRNQLIKPPLMALAAAAPKACYLALNKGDLFLPPALAGKSLGLDGSLDKLLPRILEAMKER
ncbi:MAG: hypothetical protein K6E40_12310 [Desulfovibrio sp.]|nr:hypothetical protein [Desulfovibrio sp.]